MQLEKQVKSLGGTVSHHKVDNYDNHDLITMNSFSLTYTADVTIT